MSFLTQAFATFFARLGLEKYSIPVLETPTGDAKNLQGNADGALMVDISGLAEGDLATTAKQDVTNGKLDTLHADVNGMTAKLPAALGATTSAASLSMAPASDAVFRVAAPETAPVAIRTFAATVADVTVIPTDASAWVSLAGAAYAGYADFHLAITSVGGTASPTQVTLKFWNRVGGTVAGGGAIKKIHDQTFDASQLVLPADTNPYTRIHVPCNSDEVFCTVSFPDGTAPTITGVVSARAVAFAGLQRKDLVYNPATGYPVFELRGYDSPTDTVKNSPSTFECDLSLPEPLVVNEASLAVATATFYYPSADGITVAPHNNISWDYTATGAGGGTVAVSFEATNNPAWSSPRDVSKSGWGCVAGAAVAGTVTSAANGTITEIVNFSNKGNSCVNFARLRMKVVVATANSGAFALSINRSVA